MLRLGIAKMTPLTRKAVAVAAVLVGPLVLVIMLGTPNWVVRLTAIGWGLAGLAIASLIAKDVSRRIEDLRLFTDRVPDLNSAKPSIVTADDEIGELARSLSKMTPRIEGVLAGLNRELSRREAILGSMNEAVVAVDSKLNVSFCNNAFINNVANHPVPEGVPLLKVFRDPGLFQLLQRVIRTGETSRHRLKMGGRGELTFDVYAIPLTDNSARGALSILHDVTPMEQLQRSKRDFVSNVSHEFRTPLATITGYAETLLNGGLEDERNRRKFVEIIQANSVRLTNIANDLITLSELESGTPPTEPEPIPVDQIIQTAVNAVDPVARLHQVVIRAECAAGLDVLGHPFRFEHALLNLLDNAIKFNKPDGEVEIRARLNEQGEVEISVSDTGIGIPKEDLSRIFERFYRVDKARSRQVGGTGLGLSIVRHAIEQMAGVVQVQSELGKGSCFTIRLPRFHRE
jgi:two-component system phosphate regulon sensor histidine kinase PhoR